MFGEVRRGVCEYSAGKQGDSASGEAGGQAAWLAWARINDRKPVSQAGENVSQAGRPYRWRRTFVSRIIEIRFPTVDFMKFVRLSRQGAFHGRPVQLEVSAGPDFRS